VSRGKILAIQYFEVPPEVFEDAEEMAVWIKKACGAAIRAKSAKSRKLGKA
jgi:DNA transformation protein and related proteins